MTRPLKVLVIEDSEDDALLLIRELERGGFAPEWRRVETATELKQALDEGGWEVILSDYRMPGFTGADALAMVRGRGLDTPFIVVSGTAGEAIAVHMMRDGADDYFLKGTLRLLPEAVARELREAEAHRARRQAEERLRLLTRALDASANAVIVTDRDGVIRWVNPAFTFLTGYEPEEVLGESPRILKSGEHPESFYAEMWDTILAGRMWHGELVNRRKDGTLFTEEMTITPVLDEAGEVTHFIAIKQDVSERRAMETALRRSEESYRQLFENAPEAVYIQDRDGRFLDVNRGACEMYGHEKAFFLGKTPADLAAPGMNDLHRIAALVRETFDEGTPHAFEFWGLRADGTPFPKDVRVATGTYGGRHVVVAYARDITETKAAEEALRESEERFRSLYENATIGIYRTTPDGRILMANPALVEMLGYSSFEELASRNLAEEGFEPEYPRSAFQEEIERKGEVRGLESAWRRRDGTVIYVRESARAIRDEKGRTVYYEGTVEDITERKRAEEALRESEERFRSLYENATIGIYRTTPDGRILMGNPALVEMLGYSSFEELGSLNLEDKGTYVDRSRAEFKQLLEERGEIRGLESGWRRRDGTVLWVRESARAVRDEKGRTLYYDGTVEDVTERRKAEEELRRAHELLTSSEQRLKSIVETEPECVKVLDTHGNLVEMNPAGLAMIEAGSLDEVRGKPLLSLIAPEHRAAFGKLVKSVLSGQSQRLEFEMVGLKGRRRWAETYSVPLRDAEGAVTGLLGVTRDITERREMERTLRESEERYRDLVENSHEIIGTHALDGTILSLNRAVVQVLGVPREDVVGTNLRDLVVPKHRHEVDDYLRKVAAEGEASGLMRVRRPDGAERLWDYRTSVRSEGVREPVVRCVIRDVTEEWQARKKLEESEERYRDLVEKAGVAILMDDEAGRITYCNTRALELFGYARDEIGHMSIEQLIHPDDRERVMAVHRAHLAGESGAWTYRFRGIRRDGRTLHLAVDVTPLIRGGKITGTRSYIRDVTEEQLLQAQLLQAQKMESVGRLAGGVAHDFNNILQAILAHADVALAGLGTGSPPEEHLREIRTAAERGANLTRQLLAFSRREEIHPKILDLNELTAGMLKMLRRVIGEHIEIAFQPGVEPLVVEADPGQLEQVLLNLAVNARDAMPDGGRLVIATSIEPPSTAGGPRRAVLRVTDTGCGMDEATRQRIFEPFFTTKERGQGTGLGLATVYGIVKRHHGSIDVESEPGRGTTFTVRLPAAAATAETAPAETSAETTGGNEVILVAEDDPVVRRVLVGALEDAGYTVLEAEDGAQAVELFRAHAEKVSLALLDALMPRMDGVQTMARIREIRPGLPVLFSTGYAGQALGHSLDLPPDAEMIQKPYSVSQLLSTIRRLLDSSA